LVLGSVWVVGLVLGSVWVVDAVLGAGVGRLEWEPAIRHWRSPFRA